MFSSLSITCKIKILKKQVSDFGVDSNDEVGQDVGFNTPMGTSFILFFFFTKEARIYNGEKTASSISGAGKTGQLRVKE